MKLPKPEWHLLGYLIPAMLASLFLFTCFPSYLFRLTIGICLFITLLSSIRVFYPADKLKNIKSTAPLPQILQTEVLQETSVRGIYQTWVKHSKYFFALFNCIFLSGISLIFFIFLTAANHLSPDALAFDQLKNLWEIIFPAGIGLLMAHIAASYFVKPSLQNVPSLLSATRQKTLTCLQLYLNFSSFGAIIVGLGFVILTLSNALIHLIGFNISSELQLQTMIASTLIGLPFITKRWKKRRFLILPNSRRKRLIKTSLIMVFFIIILEIITLPFTSDPITLTFIQPTLNLIQWKLFILGWWTATISLFARQITERSHGKSLSEIFITVMIASGCVYILGIFLLIKGGRDYFLTVLHQGIPALILTSLPIAAFLFNIAKFQGTVKPAGHILNGPCGQTADINSPDNIRKQERNAKYISHTLIQNIALACGLYWTTGLSLLCPLLLMVTIPSILLFLLV